MSGKVSFLGAAAASLAIAGSAQADHRPGGRSYGPITPNAGVYAPAAGVLYDAPRRVWVPAQYEIRQRHVVIPAQYQTVYEQVWVEPVYEWVTREVWAPTPRRHRHLDLNVGKFSLHLDLPGRGRKHGRRQQRRDGYYETVRERVLVHKGHYETIAREVLVRPERVEIVREHVQISDVYRTGAHRHGPMPAYDGSPRGHRRGFKAQTRQRKSKSLRRVSGKVRTGSR